MNPAHITLIAKSLGITEKQVSATAALIEEGGTVPFISRYRKEATGSLDEVQITAIRDELIRLKDLDARKDSILKSLEERNLLTDELKDSVLSADTMTRLEDIYQPFRPKRRTRATIAHEKGLTPLANFIFENQSIDYEQEASHYISAEKEVNSSEEALAGARDIIAEWISDNPESRKQCRKIYLEEGILHSKVLSGKEKEGEKYKDYFDWSEPLKSAAPHRVLAMRRGEKEGFLILSIKVDNVQIEDTLARIFIKNAGKNADQIRLAIKDSQKRLLGPSMETETRLSSKEQADKSSITVFAENLEQLLMAPALGQKKVLAIDPGFRTGCKITVLDAQGKLLFNDVIYLIDGPAKEKEACEKIKILIEKFEIEAIAIGNGTASRETESFVRSLGLPTTILVVSVNESGASVYSASEVAREEFPDHDITVRGAVSIGRRLMDPLAELVKIDPKSIGVGQYQHDVDQTLLKNTLDDVVVRCVNKVGVELNTASQQLLTYVSGLNSQIAKNITAYRNENGPFKSRKDLLKVPRLGPKAYEQAAGFLRIRDASNPLDNSAVHPEAYAIVEKMATDNQCKVSDLISSATKRNAIKLDQYISEDIGLPTLKDILEELEKPGRDPREKFETFSFMEGIEKVEDLKEGMMLPGIVTNVAAFGAFVDIGVHQDGLVHISELSDTFVKDPAQVVKVQQKVQVRVLEVDIPRKRISLSMKSKSDTRSQKAPASGSQPFNKNASRPAFQKKKEFTPKKDLQDDWFSAAIKKK